jgi:uncharacterized protein (DUF427 family)
VEVSSKHVQVIFNGVVLADTRRAKRVLETAGAPVYYIPPEDVRMDLVSLSDGGSSFCEWKGRASYIDVMVGDERALRAGWFYPEPTEGYRAIKDHIAFYVQKMEACYVDGEKARPQPGAFYGGWVTDDIVGPIKGEPGTEWW